MSRARCGAEGNDLRVLLGHVKAQARGNGGGHEHVYEYADRWPELLQYKLPVRMPSNELEVLDAFLEGDRVITEAESRLAPVADAMLYASLPFLAPPRAEKGVVSCDLVVDALCVGGRDKSPGYPLNQFYATKGEAFDDILPDLFFAVHMRLIALTYLSEHCSTANDFIHCFCADPMSFSIKREAIKVDKKGRPLMAYSMVDAAIEYIWAHTYTAGMKEAVFETHSAIGLGFSREDADLLNLSFGPGPHFTSDVPKFDGGVKYDERRRVISVAMARMRIPRTAWLYKIAQEHERAISRPAFVMTNGSVWVAVGETGQLSGRYCTARINTDVRARRSYAVDALLIGCLDAKIRELPGCAGDDAREDPTPGREEAYSYLGYPLRDVEVGSNLNFCSFDWSGEPHGVRIHKAIFNLLLVTPITKDRFAGFVRGFKTHPRFMEAVIFIFGCRPEMKDISKSFLTPQMVQFLDDNQVFYEPHSKRKKGKARKRQRAKAKKRALAAPIRMVGPSAVTSKMAMQVCSITNPFCPEAIGAKYPDNATTKSATFTLRRPFIATTDANGNAAWLWAANWGGNGAAATVTGTTAAYTDIVQNMSQFPANVSRYRLVSWGVQVTPIVAPLSASGMIRVRLFSPEGGTSLTSIDTTSNLADDSYDVPLARNQRDLFILPKRYGMESTMFQNAQTATSVLTDWNNPGWQVIQIAVTNGPANTTVLQMSVYYHYEVVYLDGDPGNYYATPAPVVAPKVIETSSGVISKIGSFVEGTANTVDRLIQSSAFKYLGAAVGAYIGGPTGAMNGYQIATQGQSMRRAITVD